MMKASKKGPQSVEDLRRTDEYREALRLARETQSDGNLPEFVPADPADHFFWMRAYIGGKADTQNVQATRSNRITRPQYATLEDISESNRPDAMALFVSTARKGSGDSDFAEGVIKVGDSVLMKCRKAAIQAQRDYDLQRYQDSYSVDAIRSNLQEKAARGYSEVVEEVDSTTQISGSKIF